MWALQAIDANSVIEDVLTQRSGGGVGSSRAFTSVAAHLAAAGIDVTLREEGFVCSPLDVKAKGLRRLPKVVVDELLAPPRRGSNRSEPLHDSAYHGAYLPEAACACGVESKAGVLCTVCGELARHRDGPERFQPLYYIELPLTVPHPWSIRPGARGRSAWAIDAVVLLPPAYRSGGAGVRDPLDGAYERLIRLCHQVAAEQAGATGSGAFAEEERRWRSRIGWALRAVIGRLGDEPEAETLSARLSGKTGLLRRGLRGRNTNWSARLVMVADPDRDPETVGLPEEVIAALRAGLPDDQDKEHADVVIINRPPTLLPYNLIALRAEPAEGAVARIHPMLCKCLAGDFDGDENLRPSPGDVRRQDGGLGEDATCGPLAQLLSRPDSRQT